MDMFRSVGKRRRASAGSRVPSTYAAHCVAAITHSVRVSRGGASARHMSRRRSARASGAKGADIFPSRVPGAGPPWAPACKGMLRLLLASLACALAQKPGPVPDAGPTVSVDLDGLLQRVPTTLDANWRWVHESGGYRNCFSGVWDAALCPDAATCAERCVVEGVTTEQYEHTYGVRQAGEGVRLGYVTGGNVGSRLYLLRGDTCPAGGAQYLEFQLLNKEISIQVDLSAVPCGVNAAAYLVGIPADGGSGPGAQLGGGYGDAQCPTDIKFPGGLPNMAGLGSCAPEVDLVEANSRAMAWTLHPCAGPAGPCSGDACAAACDRAGAYANAYRRGFRDFYGPGLRLDTSRPFEAVTRFEATDGQLVAVRRHYLQDGRRIEDPGGPITDASAANQSLAFGEPDGFARFGGLRAVGEALRRGMVLVLSIWDDTATGMQWLDGTWPASGGPGSARGPCAPSSVSQLRASQASASVTFGRIRVSSL